MNSIETVFEWLLAATLRASVLVVVILCIQSVLRRWLPASWRHALWLPMLAVLVLPVLPEAPFALFPRTAAAQPAAVVAERMPVEKVAPVVLTALDERSAAALPMAAAPVINSAPASARKLNILAILWLAGAGAVLAAGWIGYHRNLRRIRTNSTSPDQLLQVTLAETALVAGLKRAPRTVISPAVASPAVTGLIRPVLLLPAGFPAGFSPAEARLILLHEFTHLKRLDLPLNWLMCVLQAMHWFNPLLWFAFARMRADRESACDARVLSIDASDRRAEYGGALLKLQCVTPTRALSLGFVGIFERGSEIKSRIRDISTHRRTRLARQIAGGVIVTLLMMFGVTKAQQDSPPADGPNTVKEESDKAKHPEMLINILKDGKIRVEGQESTDQELTARIGSALKKFPDHPFRIKADGDVKYQDVVTVIDLCKRAGAWNLSFAPESVKEDPAKALIQNKLNTIIIPTIDFVDVSVEEAIEFLRIRAAQLDVDEKDPAKKRINFVIRNPVAGPAPMIRELRVRNVPLATVLRYICDQTNFRFTVEHGGVILSPREEAGAGSVAAADPARDGRDSNAARIETLSQITSQVGKYPHPTSEFFKSACLLTELQRILGPDYKAYRDHLLTAGSGMLEKEGDYVCGDVSQLHVGGYGSLFYVDPKNNKMYLFWLKKRVLDKEYQIYGDGPIPAAVLSSIAKHMNEEWGHVATFRFDGERLVIEKAK